MDKEKSKNSLIFRDGCSINIGGLKRHLLTSNKIENKINVEKYFYTI
jgi:hypothetical protein